MKKLISFVLVLAAVFVLVGCNKGSSIVNIKGEDIFTKDGNYFVFFYKDNCPDCEQAKPYVELYLDIIKNNSEYKSKSKIYGVNLDHPDNALIYREYFGDPYDDAQPNNFWVNNVEEWEDLYIGGVASLISIRTVDGRTFAYFEAQGYEDIYNRLDKHLG